MKNHTKVYLKEMGYDKVDWIECEICGTTAVDIHHIDPRGMDHESSFDVVQHSRLIESFRSSDYDHKVTPEHQHFSFCTYDDIFEIVASSYDLTIGESRSKKQRLT